MKLTREDLHCVSDEHDCECGWDWSDPKGKLMVEQILENQEQAEKCDGTCQPYGMRPTYQKLEEENMLLKEKIEQQLRIAREHIQFTGGYSGNIDAYTIKVLEQIMGSTTLSQKEKQL